MAMAGCRLVALGAAAHFTTTSNVEASQTCDAAYCPEQFTALLQHSRSHVHLSRARGELQTRDSALLQRSTSHLNLHAIRARSEARRKCPGSGTACRGNSCCPGIGLSNHRAFPCPDSDADFDGCEASRAHLPFALTTIAEGLAGDGGFTGIAPAIQCPGSGGQCSGNACCPGVNATDGRSFPCPNADLQFRGCDAGFDSTFEAILNALTKAEKHQFLRGTGWIDGSWDLNPEYFIGNAGMQTPRFGIPPLNMQDNGQGFRTVAEDIIPQVTSWPEALAVASSWSEADIWAWAAAMGKEFKLKGSNVILGPGLNVHRVARGGRNGEYMSGESPYFGTRMAKPYVMGVQSQGVLAVAKHFVLNNQETNRDTVNSKADDRTMWEVYYPPFEAAIEAGAASVMCGYNLVNGVHACGNADILNQDLKKDMNFKGWVQSDWWALHNFSAKEGVDQEMPGDSTPRQKAWFTDGNLDTLSDDKVDDMFSRIVKPMLTNGLFEPASQVCTPPRCHKEIFEVVATSPDHQLMSKELAAKAVVLLKNENDVLPLLDEVKKIALLGPACDAPQDVKAQLATWDLGSYYNIGGSGRVIADVPESITQGVTSACEEFGCEVTVYTGLDVGKATEAASDADVAIICGGASSTEGKDRSTLSVDDEDFLRKVAAAIEKPTISLTMTPAATVMPWMEDVDAAMNVFLAGKYTGSAFADALFGVRNPSAKLLVTIPVSEESTIAPCRDVDCPYDEKLNVGYLRMSADDVLFPFGHGLSYTTFGYALKGVSSQVLGLKDVDGQNKSVDCRGYYCVRAAIQNTGKVDGAEIAQLYLTFPEAAGEPANQLRGFVRTVELLSGDEEEHVFELTDRDISVYNPEQRAWEKPKGEFVWKIGASSQNLKLQGTFTVA